MESRSVDLSGGCLHIKRLSDVDLEFLAADTQTERSYVESVIDELRGKTG